jgi:uncharacterized membrane protein SpoIIM required for sporulation
VNREIFERQYEPEWRDFERMLERLEARGGRRAGSDSTGGPSAFPEAYRRICHHLALARHRRYGADLELRLNRLALRGHQQLYRTRTAGLDALLEFFGVRFPQRVRAQARLVLLATLLFAGPALILGPLVAWKPAIALSVIPAEQLEDFGRQYARGGDLAAGRPVDSDVMMFGFYIHNNIGIAFRTFAGGVLGGIGSIFFLVYNGIFFGAVAGHIHQAGYDGNFYPFVIGHGAFELTAIVLSGAAGLRLGFALLAPGRRRRSQALREAAHEAVPVLAGAAVMLVAAAFLEAFWSSSSAVPAAVKLAVGTAFWALVLTYLTAAGRKYGS